MNRNAIETLSGKVFDFVNISPDNVDINDIATVLGRLPRWLGHTQEFYSVAQHCCWCHDSTTGDPFEALMHDASEAYVGDCPSPFKKLLPKFIEIENEIQGMLAKKYGYQYPFSKETHEADKEALVFEYNHIKLISTIEVQCWNSERAVQEFLDRFYKYVAIPVKQNTHGRN